MWRKFGAFVTCVHISFKFGFKQPSYIILYNYKEEQHYFKRNGSNVYLIKKYQAVKKGAAPK